MIEPRQGGHAATPSRPVVRVGETARPGPLSEYEAALVAWAEETGLRVRLPEGRWFVPVG